MSDYTTPKPKVPVIIKLLQYAVGLSLICMGPISYGLFTAVVNWLGALGLTVIVGAAIYLEAINIVTRGRPIWVGLITSIMLSGYFTFERMRLTPPPAVPGYSFLVWSMALVPSLIIFFMALTLSHELRQYEKQIQQWAADQKRAI